VSDASEDVRRRMFAQLEEAAAEMDLRGVAADNMRAVDGLRSERAALVAELNQLRLENHRLRELVQVVDVNHIRLRDGLKRAIAAMDAHDHHAGVCDDVVMPAAELAELRKLVTP
jgi:regulator of replication initiation timing